jgi:hypothetical protein
MNFGEVENSGGMVSYDYGCEVTNTNPKQFNLDFTSGLGATNDVLQDFDFDSFLHDGDDNNGPFDFNPATFGMEGGEIVAD